MLVGLSYFPERGGKLHFHGPIGELVFGQILNSLPISVPGTSKVMRKICKIDLKSRTRLYGDKEHAEFINEFYIQGFPKNARF